MFLKGCCLFFAFFPCYAFCQSTDSVRRTFAPPITVTSDSYNPETIIHPLDLRQETAVQLEKTTGAALLSEALRALHPSLDIREYGPIGGIALASFRGLPAEYSTVYWEGVKLTDAQKSLSDLALIDIHSIGSVGIISSANAQLIGGDVAGAGILLNTSASRLSGITISAFTTSYDDLKHLNEKNISLSGSSQLTSNTSVFGGITSTYSDGAFPFQSIYGTRVLRENNDAHLLNVSGGGEYVIDENSSIKAFSYFTRDERGAPAQAVSENSGAIELLARQYDENYLAALSFHHSPEAAFDYSINIGYQSQYETYTNPPVNVYDHYLNRIFSFGWKARDRISNHANVFGGIDYTNNLLFSNENALSVADTNISRESYSAYLAVQYFLLENLDITGSLRTDRQSDIKNFQTVPGVSIHFEEPHSRLILQASFGSLYHAPTFNELYWRVGGNPNLRVETGTTSEITMMLPLSFANISVSNQLTGFYTNLANQIIWIDGTQGFSIPVQVQSSNSKGAEWTGEVTDNITPEFTLFVREALSRTWTTNLSPDIQYHGKELPYSTPMRSLFSLRAEHNQFGSLTFTAFYRGHRYADFTNNPDTKLPPVTLYNLIFTTAPVEVGKVAKISARLSVLNVANTQYSEVPDYPLPGRTIRFSLDFHFLN